MNKNLLTLTLALFSVGCINSVDKSAQADTIAKEAGRESTLEDLRLKGIKFKNARPYKENENKIHRDPAEIIRYNLGRDNVHLKGVYSEFFMVPGHNLDEVSVEVYEYSSPDEMEKGLKVFREDGINGSMMSLGRFLIVLNSTDDITADENNMKVMSDFYFDRGAVLRVNELDRIKRKK
ncbi:hypothetical protein [Pedobacter steynii]|uniref:Lipoprotein n=1 Tax=Pedobacter steynii TaxID=430522 RepID=A0A1D7QNJ0_9SPHI|nr:hypothetical protein [Pedobacter steynii]AOM80203.1 hypothetical protein BFS30_25390 [Pedobacter steynii]